DVVNVAQRLQLSARPNRVLVGPATYQTLSTQSAGRFGLNSIGQLELRGRIQAVEAFEVQRS
ncbi:MAG: hypothetical protein JNK29_07255, partial [Anaerolineales bacterium]|nr:hypothetical protein [Anaerolineales bacterium]